MVHSHLLGDYAEWWSLVYEQIFFLYAKAKEERFTRFNVGTYTALSTRILAYGLGFYNFLVTNVLDLTVQQEAVSALTKALGKIVTVATPFVDSNNEETGYRCEECGTRIGTLYDLQIHKQSCDGKQRQRSLFNETQTTVMHFTYGLVPMPSKQIIQELAAKLNLDYTPIYNWFANRRKLEVVL